MKEKTSFRTLIPESQNVVFTITKPVSKAKTPNGHPYYIFETSCVIDGERRPLKKFVMCFLAKDLLLALGYPMDEKGDIEWDRDEVQGKQFVADLIHKRDLKGELREEWINFQPVVAPKAVAKSDEDDQIPF